LPLFQQSGPAHPISPRFLPRRETRPPPPTFPACSHQTNAWLGARALKPRKGCIETINGAALAADLALAGRRGGALAAAAAALGADRPQPPPPPRGPPLEERAFWAELRPCGTLALPRYDRAGTHDPALGAEEVAPDAAALVVEGLFLGRGDGAHGGGCDPVGGAPGAWAAVRAELADLVALSPPLALCRARVLARRMRAAPPERAAAAAHLAAAEQHYARADLPTFLELRRDAARASLVLRVALPEPLRRAAAAAAAGDGGAGASDAAALAIPGDAALRALAEAEATGGGAFAGLEVEAQGCEA
jgi:hypothetical protein